MRTRTCRRSGLNGGMCVSAHHRWSRSFDRRKNVEPPKASGTPIRCWRHALLVTSKASGRKNAETEWLPPLAIGSIDFLLNPCIFGQIWQLYKSFARARGTSIPVIHQKVRPAMRTSDFNPLSRTSSAFQPLSLDDLCRSDLYICHIVQFSRGSWINSSNRPEAARGADPHRPAARRTTERSPGTARGRYPEKKPSSAARHGRKRSRSTWTCACVGTSSHRTA